MIFVLDDSPSLLKALERVLRRYGEVRCSSLWSELSSEILRASPTEFHVLVCDLEMPGISGADFCRIVRKHCPWLPTILYTGAPHLAPPDAADVVLAKTSGVEPLLDTITQLKRAHRSASSLPSPPLLKAV